MTASNDLIHKILSTKLEQNKQSTTFGSILPSTPAAQGEDGAQVEMQPKVEKVPLKVSSYVVEIEIQPKRKPETYDRDA